MDQPQPNVFADAAPHDGGVRGRDSLLLMATLSGKDLRAPMTVRVRNLSPGGLMAELPVPIAADAAVEIDLRGVGRIAGRVAWQTLGRAGIAFDQEIDPHLARKPVVGRAEDNVRRVRFGK